MLAIFLKTVPFFALIALGYAAGRTKFFTSEATAYLTKFVFWFALSAMLFNFAANLTLAEILDWRFITAYLWGTVTVYLIATAVGILRRLPIAESAVEAQCAVIGNVGFLGIPMFVLLLGPESAGPMLMVLATDLIFFSSCNEVKFYSNLLNYVDVPVMEIHGKQKQQKRSSTFYEFSELKSGVLLCTDVVARGIDIPEVDWIIQYDPPLDIK